ASSDSRVLLPEPDAPTTATTSPRAISKPTPSRMVSGPEGSATRLPRPRTRRAGASTAGAGSAAAWGAGASAMFIPDWLSWTAGAMRTTERSVDAAARRSRRGTGDCACARATLRRDGAQPHRRPACPAARKRRPCPLWRLAWPDAMGHRFTPAAGAAAGPGPARPRGERRPVVAHGAGHGRLALGRLRHGRAPGLGVAAGRAPGAREARLARGQR